jgi:hypothetical protein
MDAPTSAAILARASRRAELKADTTSDEAAAAGLRNTTISVTVWTFDGIPIPNATVRLTRGGANLREFQTDAEGEYVFHNIDSGQYVVDYVSNNGGSKDGTKPSASKKPLMSIPIGVSLGDSAVVFFQLPPPEEPQPVPVPWESILQAAKTAGVTTVITPGAPFLNGPEPCVSPPCSTGD